VQVNEIREKYLAFFKARGHVIVSSASLVPEGDATTLFTGNGMQPMVPYLLGASHPSGTRIADVQKSFRAEDIAEVGDNRHTTFFEMLGNWSFGDYWKKEQLTWCFEFLTKELGFPKERLWVTCFEGDTEKGIPKDTESAEIWKELGIPEDHIRFYEAKNWWSRAGAPSEMPEGEPGGPDSEVFYEFTQVAHDAKFGDECHPNCDCGRFLEICNSVFMQYVKIAGGGFQPLPKQNVDFGGGLERIAAASENNPDIFVTDVFIEPIRLLEHMSGKHYVDSRYARSFRIIADHARAVTFILADGVRPSNTERGYVLRRLIRRAALHALKLDFVDKDKEDSALVRCATIYLEKYRQAYPELAGEEMYATVTNGLWEEERNFAKTLTRGMREFEKIAADGHISGEQAFLLTTTYGFPFEMMAELAHERAIEVDEVDFQKLMKEHQGTSRAGAEKKFKGGLADSSEQTTRLHTAHHLLLKSLQMVLGPHVKQRGSNITQERLRIDFSHGEKMTKEQIAEVERIVNEKIAEALPVVCTEMAREEAEQLGAEHEFGAKYTERVSVYSVGQPDNVFSIEFCGGPHVANTGGLGTFKILKEEAVAAGIRRIKATLA